MGVLSIWMVFETKKECETEESKKGFREEVIAELNVDT